MSRKSFIITALMINLTICVTLCIVLFTGTGGKVNASVAESKSEAEQTRERPSNQAIVNIEDIQDTDSYIGEEMTTKIIESQVVTDTQPHNYKSSDLENIEEQATTQEQQSSQTSEENPQNEEEQTITVLGTMAVMTGSCNIRSTRDVGNNIIGEANAGATYRIEPSQCTANWVAIYIDDENLGYVSTAFCDIQ